MHAHSAVTIPYVLPAQFVDMKDAVRALEATNGKQFMQRTITVEYVQNENPFGSRDGDGSKSPPRRRWVGTRINHDHVA